MLPKQISAAQLEFNQFPTGPTVPTHLKLVLCSVVNRLHNSRCPWLCNTDMGGGGVGRGGGGGAEVT